MPIFTRRRLQNMLDTIGPSMTSAQANDLLKRLEHREATSALAAEIELGLLWSLSQVTKIELHPELPTSKRRPDAYAKSLLKSSPAFVEITAVSDDEFSDRDKMERAANIISQFANRIRRNSGKNLYFRFNEKSGYENGQYVRFRRITNDFRLTPTLEKIIQTWLDQPDWPNPPHIRLTNENIDVIVEWKSYVHLQGRTFSTMPAIAYDVEDNPVYKALDRKRSQLSAVPSHSLKCIFLGDAGCDTLRNLRPLNASPQTVSGDQIIRHFLNKSKIDIVAVFSPQRANIYNPINSPLIWKSEIYDRRETWPPHEHDCLGELATKLPRPNYEAYQARSLHRQAAFDPQTRGHYLGTLMTGDVRTMETSIKFPARLFQELIAGRISIEQFRHFSSAFELFEAELKSGRTMQNARIEPAGLAGC